MKKLKQYDNVVFNEPLSFHRAMSTNSRKLQLLQGASPWASPHLPPLVSARQCLGRGDTLSTKQRRNGGALPLAQLPPAQPPNPASFFCCTKAAAVTQRCFAEGGFHKLQLMSGCLNFTTSTQPILSSFFLPWTWP